MLKKTDSKALEFIIENEATIRNEEEFYNLFNSQINNSDNFLIKLKNIKNIDLSFIQLLLSIRKTLNNLNKELTFEIEIIPASLKILNNAGINPETLLKVGN